MDIQLKNGQILSWAGISPEVYTALQIAEGEEFAANKNAFLNKLINKIAETRIYKASVRNIFSKYDSFEIKYGDTIENIFVDIPMGYDYDITKAGTNLLAPVKPQVDVLYATMNYQKQYKITVYDTQIRMAVRNEYGLQRLVEYLIASMYDAADLDEYFATIAMLSSMETMYANGFETVDTTSTAIGKTATDKIIDVVASFKYPNKTNNVKRFINPSSQSDILLLIKESTLRKINLDFLAGVFNLDKVDLINNIVSVESFVVPVYNPETGTTEYKGTDLDFVIIDTRGFDFHLALNTSGLFYNPEGLFTNHYHNRWRLFNYKLWFNARAFKLNITDNQ